MQQSEFYIIQPEDLEWCEKNKVKVTFPGQWDYPKTFANLLCRPGVLFYLGSPVWLSYTMISVVGSRSPQQASLTWLDDVLSEALKLRKMAVVSGGARGIDQKAHQVAMRADLPTVALLPAGLRFPYPYEFGEWIPEIIKSGGCVVSQFQPSHKMQKRYFRERNVLIAALSELTLIVECRRRSGTMLTAKNCMELGRSLAVMPTYPHSAGLGGLDLIFDGALPIRDAKDLLSAIGHAPELIRAVK